MNPAERSSSRTWSARRGSAATARASGVDREPGQTTAWRTPARTHSSTSVAQKAAWRSPPPGGVGRYAHRQVLCRTSPTPTVTASPPTCTPSPGRGPAPGAGPRVHPDRTGVGRAGRRPGRRPRAGAGRPARPRGLGGRAAPTSRRGPRCSARPVGPADYLGYSMGARVLPAPGPAPGPTWSPAGPGVGHGRHRRRRRAGGAAPGGRRGPGRAARPGRWRAGRRTRSPSSSTGGWPTRCSATCRPRPTGSTSASATRAAGLASSLRLAGTGTQEPLWDRLGELGHAGAGGHRGRDAKFTALGRRLVGGHRSERPPCGGRGRRPRAPPAAPDEWRPRVREFLGRGRLGAEPRPGSAPPPGRIEVSRIQQRRQRQPQGEGRVPEGQLQPPGRGQHRQEGPALGVAQGEPHRCARPGAAPGGAGRASTGHDVAMVQVTASTPHTATPAKGSPTQASVAPAPRRGARPGRPGSACRSRCRWRCRGGCWPAAARWPAGRP